MENDKCKGKLGRPREFDADEALCKALGVFWRLGYEGASLQDLTEAMGISRPSLYAAFGNKEALFRKALDKYLEGPGSVQAVAMAKPTARETVEHLMRSSAGNESCNNPAGCLLVHGALACGEESNAIRQELIARRTAGQRALQERLERAQRDGELSSEASPEDLARYISTIMQGMAVQSGAGTTSAELHRVVDLTMAAWPNLVN